MSTSIVVDASLAMKWVVPEHDSGQARALLGNTLTARQKVYAPPHFLGEVVNALYQRVRTSDPAKHIDRPEADQALASLLALPITAVSHSTLYPLALDFANRHSLATVYDSLDVILAQLLGLELWTADQRLVAHIGDAAPWVRLLREYSGT